MVQEAKHQASTSQTLTLTSGRCSHSLAAIHAFDGLCKELWLLQQHEPPPLGTCGKRLQQGTLHGKRKDTDVRFSEFPKKNQSQQRTTQKLH